MNQIKRRQMIAVTAASMLAAVNVHFARAQQLGDVFVIDMENHNLTQPGGAGNFNYSAGTGNPNQLQGNPAMPYMNSLITPGNANASNTSWTSTYNNVGTGIHPSEPNYVWQEGGSNYGVAGDADPYTGTGASYPNGNVFSASNLSGLLQARGIAWKSYQEDVDLNVTSGSVNQPGSNALSSTVAPQNQWTVPLKSFSGNSSSYTNAYNLTHQYNFAPKHDGTLFYTATNGGNNLAPTNSETSHYAPLQQLTPDLSSNSVGRYNLITPDQFNDGHTALSSTFTYAGTTYAAGTDEEAIAQADNFLSQIVPQIEASQAFQNNGAIVIWWDETEGGDTSGYTLPEIVISPLAKGNAYNSNSLSYTHSSDLKTLQEVFQVPDPTQADAYIGGASTANAADLSDLFQAGTIPTSVPEPTSLGLLGVGAMSLLNRRRRNA